MRIDEAIEKLDAIHAATDRVSTYQGFRARPIAMTGVLGILGALIQPYWMRAATDPVGAFLVFWCCLAVTALAIVVADMLIRYQRDPTARERRLTLAVLTRLAPCLGVGAGLSLVVGWSAGEAVWMLPGLWSILLGLGITAASGVIPPMLRQVSIWYLGCGFVMLLVARGDDALHPLTMAIPFGCGGLLTAWLIHTSNGGDPAKLEQ